MADSEDNRVGNKTASLMISYSRKDTDFVRKIYDGLVAEGFPPGKDSIWVDWEGIPLSADWMAEITKGIQSANAFIFVISPDSVKSEVCQREIEIAVAGNKRFIPILYKEPGRDTKLHEKISSHNWIFMHDEKELEEKLPALVNAINTDLVWLAQHTRLYNRASEWDGKGRNDSYLVRGSDLADAETFISEGATGKEPAPTPLHIEYVQAARKFAAARQRRNRIIAAIVGVALLGLSIFALAQWRNAVISRDKAEAAQALAEENEKIAKAAEAEAQTQREAAEANEAKARQKERVSTANVLAAEAINQKNSDTQLSLVLALLSIQETELDGTVLVESKSALFSSLNTPNVIHTWDNDGALVWEVAIDANSKYAATGDDDGVVQIYDVEGYQLIRKIKMEDKITGLDFSPDGSRIGIASGPTASVWDVESGDEIFQLDGHDEYWIEDIKFSPNGDLIATGGDDWNVKLWNADTGSIRTTLPGHEDIVNSIAFSGDGAYLVSGSDDDTAVLWDVESASFVNRYRPDGFETDGSYIGSVAFDQWGTRVITGGYQTVVVWDAYDDYEEIFRLRGNRADVYAVDFAPDSLSMLSASSGVKIWDWFYGTERYNLSSHRGEVTSAVFSEDGNYLLTGSWDNTSKLWSANLKIETLRLTQHDDLNVDAGYSPDGKWIVTTDGSGFVFVHDSETGEVIYVYEVADDEWVNAATFNPQDNRQFATADDAGQLQLWQLDDSESIWSVTAHDGSAFSAEFSPDGGTIVTSGDDGYVYLWDAETGDLVREIFVDGVAYDARFSPDGSRIVTADKNKIGQVWDANTGELIMNLEGHTDFVLAAVYSNDGKYIYTGGYDNTIRKWDAETGVSLLTLTGHTGRVLDLDVSPDNTLLVSGSADTTVKVWDAETGKEIFNYQGNNEESSSVEFRPDGKRVVTASAANASKEFTVDYDELLQIAQEYELRDLTEEECLRYLKRNSCVLHLFGQTDAGEGPALQSGDGDVIVTLIVENNSAADVDVNWIDFDGVEKTYFTLAPGEYAEQGTYSMHVWRVRDAEGNILLDYVVTEDPKQTINVTDTGASGIEESTPGDAIETAEPAVGSSYTEEFDEVLGTSWNSFMTSGDDGQVSTSYENGSLNIQLSQFEEKIARYYLVNSESAYSSVQLELLTTNNGNNANGVSLVCQYSDNGWYEFRISNSGFYSVDAFDPTSGYIQLVDGGSSAINAGRSTNTYTAICDGNELTLLINGEQVATTTDTRFNFSTGEIGIGVSFSPEDMLPVDVLIDTLTVSEP